MLEWHALHDQDTLAVQAVQRGARTEGWVDHVFNVDETALQLEPSADRPWRRKVDKADVEVHTGGRECVTVLLAAYPVDSFVFQSRGACSNDALLAR